MDTAVDDFLKEINELLPPKPKVVWKECFDETSGFAYYWNTETDEVTWEAPAEYKRHSKGGSKLFIPPPSEPKFKLGSLPKVDEVNVKIYKINESIASTVKEVKPKEKTVDKVHKLGNEKVALISSYGTSSDSESETEENIEDGGPIVSGPPDEVQSDTSDFEDEVDILTQIQRKANDLRKLGGEVPSEVKKLIEPSVPEKKALSLVPLYADDSDDEFEPEFPPSDARLLFPAAKNIEEVNRPAADLTEAANDEIDTKAFQRKRRIGVSLMNTSKKKATESAQSIPSGKRIEYPGFKSGGVLFGTVNDSNADEPKGDDRMNREDENKLIVEIKEVRDTLEEKLRFLCEGHQQALPVQVMIIQMETLYTAMNEDCLKPTYLKDWLNSTLEDLTKLEKEAAPPGWLLQWDRVHKRYYYHNQATGDSQWDFPQADGIRTEEAMDISMTPPHATCDENPSNGGLERDGAVPPPPPIIREKSMSPPPPPVISKVTGAIEQPLPPGVDDDVAAEKVNGKDENNGAFSSELSSFYSDIAAIESSQPQSSTKTELEPPKQESVPVQPAKKKKKVKVASGLAMKKKGVSQMVEKWKNLQKNYD